ncbi:MAG: substrate-binding domain-containing protein [Dehalococcoidales bacterium]|nr:substrate-binding domain-containing protein [Dehalococcoidales bacterium]
MKRSVFCLSSILLLLSLAVSSLLMSCSSSAPANTELILATTTSTQDSGLLDVLIPMFEEQTGYHVKTIAVGTGAALAMGQRGEADVLLVHKPSAELPLMENGDAISRKLVMHNDFIIVGPPSDPAGIKGITSATDAYKKIADSNSIFISRGDASGTNKTELDIWKTADIEPAGQSWYQESGQGMGATLTIASEKQAYTMTDRATYLATKANLELDLLGEGDPLLLNIYHVMQVNPDKNDKINAEGAKAFADFMAALATQEVIKNFGVDKYGQPLFFPDADKTEADLGSF